MQPSQIINVLCAKVMLLRLPGIVHVSQLISVAYAGLLFTTKPLFVYSGHEDDLPRIQDNNM